MTIKKISPSVIKLWRIKAVIHSAVFILIVLLALLIFQFFSGNSLPQWLTILISIELLLQSVFMIFIRPSLKGKHWRYSFEDDRIMLKTGIWFRDQVTIPMIRIQNIESNVGPIAKKLDLTSLSVTTASDTHKLPELNTQEALELQKWVQTIIHQTI